MNGIRYPELRQFPVKFMGYIFWKHNNQINEDDHVIEQHDSAQSLSLIHQEMLNKPFTPQTSPWEVILMNMGQKTLVIGRFHHSIADAKSIVNLFVECLGNHELMVAQPRQIEFGVVDKVLMPIRFIPFMANELHQIISFWSHPWKVEKTKKNINYSLPQSIRFSAKLSLADIKKIGQATGGTASSVILAIISGSISKVRSDLENLSSVYALPKEYPLTLGNHADYPLIVLPKGKTTTKRLETCHNVYKELRTSKSGYYMRAVLYMIGTMFNPMRKMIVQEVSSCPMVINNIPGESKGFSIGERGCVEFVFSVGTLCGDAGVAFCISSYMDSLQIAVISKEGCLSENELEKLADGIIKELDCLKLIISG